MTLMRLESSGPVREMSTSAEAADGGMDSQEQARAARPRPKTKQARWADAAVRRLEQPRGLAAAVIADGDPGSRRLEARPGHGRRRAPGGRAMVVGGILERPARRAKRRGGGSGLKEVLRAQAGRGRALRYHGGPDPTTNAKRCIHLKLLDSVNGVAAHIQAAVDVARGKDHPTAQIVKLRECLQTASEQVLALREQVTALEREKSKLEERLTQRVRFEHERGEFVVRKLETGSVVYMRKESGQGEDDPVIYYC